MSKAFLSKSNFVHLHRTRREYKCCDHMQPHMETEREIWQNSSIITSVWHQYLRIVIFRWNSAVSAVVLADNTNKYWQKGKLMWEPNRDKKLPPSQILLIIAFPGKFNQHLLLSEAKRFDKICNGKRKTWVFALPVHCKG